MDRSIKKEWKKIVIVVEGGFVRSIEQIPDYTIVEVRDFDCDEVPDESDPENSIMEFNDKFAWVTEYWGQGEI